MTSYFSYSQFHGKNPPVGSTHIRMIQMEKYWPELKAYQYGEKPDVLIFQKVYTSEDYKFPGHYPGKTILDICDPDWMEGVNIVESCHAVDAVVCPTEALAAFLRQFTKNVRVIPDRFDLEPIPEPKKHTQKAKTIVWFGYSHNAEALRPAIALIEELKLNLVIISNDDPIANRWGVRDANEYYKYIKYDEDTIYEELQKADFAILPDGLRPHDKYKSNNKTIKANLAGLPVAKTPEEVNLYMSGEERQKWVDSNLEAIRDEYDIRRSVEEYKELINEVTNSRH